MFSADSLSLHLVQNPNHHSDITGIQTCCNRNHHNLHRQSAMLFRQKAGTITIGEEGAFSFCELPYLFFCGAIKGTTVKQNRRGEYKMGILHEVLKQREASQYMLA